MAVARLGTPAYINYLLSPDTPLDFHINVGDPEESTPERIGAVKWMLIARSKVLRVMLLESKIKESSEFPILDIDPKTFKNFLTYLYGYDNTSTLPFEDSIKLLNAAEKYDVEDLKECLGQQIQERVTPDNIFTVLRYPEVCEQVAPLWETTTEIIQYQTELVLVNTQFKDLSLEAVQFILQQDCLSVTEVAIWRAALGWAKHKGDLLGEPVTGEMLRGLMLSLMKHIRLCTFTLEQFSFEVVLTDILTFEEVKYVLRAIKKEENINKLSIVNSSIVKRLIEPAVHWYKNAGKEYTGLASKNSNFPTIFWILTSNSPIQLCALVCKGTSQPHKNKCIAPTDTVSMYQCHCEVTISEVETSIRRRSLDVETLKRNTSSRPFVTVNFNEQVKWGEDFEIPVRQGCKNVMLQPNKDYAVTIKFSSVHPVYHFPRDENFTGYTQLFHVVYDSLNYRAASANWYGSHMKMFKYRRCPQNHT